MAFLARSMPQLLGRDLPGSLSSHASRRTAARRAFGQCRRTCDLVMRFRIFYSILISRQRRSSRRDMWSRKDKRKKKAAQTKETRRPPRCAVRKTRGQEYPLTRVEVKRKEKNNLAISSTLLHLFSFPGYPLVHSGRVCPVLIRSISHRPSHPRQF